MSVERWKAQVFHSANGDYPHLYHDPKGNWVRYEDYAQLTAELEAARRDAERIAFLDTVSIVIHVRNGRRYEAGPGNARYIIDAASAYNAARHQEATNGR